MPDLADPSPDFEFTFLLCSERSGSNLITSVMNGHPCVSGPPPSHLFRLFGLNADRYWPTIEASNFAALTTDFADAHATMLGEWHTRVTVNELRTCSPDRGIAGLLDHVYRKEAAVDRASTSFVKENYTYRIVPFLLANWPTARFVHQVRDPRDVAASYLRTASIPGGVEAAVDRWIQDQEGTLAVFSQIRSSGRAMRVRYEDLVTQPEATTRALCHALHLPPADDMMSFHTDPRTRRNADRVDAWTNLSRPVMRENVGKYTEVLADADLRYVEIATAELMPVFGYAPVTAVADLSPSDRGEALRELLPHLSRAPDLRITTSAEARTRRERQHVIERVLAREPKP
ncbi:MAG: sulfotransferase [Actinomycetota bacterium]